MNIDFNKRRIKLIGSPIQRKTLILVFIAAVMPAAIVAICLYYLIFNMLAYQLGIPEIIAYNLIPVAKRISIIMIMAMPVTLFFIWLAALELSHTIAGPIQRLEKELDDRIDGKKHTHIQLREKDELKPLVDRINKLLSR
jgi:nitrogen fixation/metabolism regulation signal transduction histidine kinase